MCLLFMVEILINKLYTLQFSTIKNVKENLFILFID
jgi:hypothetical protein